jgi:hypothetical protein
MKQCVQFLLLLACTVGFAAAQNESAISRDGAYWVQTFNGTVVTARSAERFRVQTTGDVELRGAASGVTTYVLKARVRARDAREAESLLRQLEIKSGADGEWTYLTIRSHLRMNEGLQLTLMVPRSLRQTRVETRGGNVQASDLDGDIETRSAGGEIAVDRIRGRAELRTAGGDIQVGSVGGLVRCFSGGGAIRVEHASGECWTETAGGEIFVRQVTGPLHAATAGGNIRVEHASGTVFARTAGGLIQVQQADGAVTAESSGGAIQVNAAKGVQCESAAGAIRLRNVAGALHASTNAGNIVAELLSGSQLADSSFSANSGDITVIIPSNVPVTVQARNEFGGAGRIMSDFPQIQQAAGAERGAGPAVAGGALNGGGPVLRINVMGGTIYLRREK